MTITPESVQQLLNSESFGDRLSGLNKLRQLEVKIAFEMLQPLVTDVNTRVRYVAVSQFDTLGQQDLDKSLEVLCDRLLYDAEPDVQAAAADALGGLKLTVAFPHLETRYRNTTEWLVQFSIIATLGELGDPRGFELLKEALNSDNPLIKTAAVSSLGELGDPRAVALLIPFVHDPDWQVRYRLIQSLGRLGGEESQKILTKLAQDEVEQVAQEAKNHLKSKSIDN
jgi:HEAT repeat protein